MILSGYWLFRSLLETCLLIKSVWNCFFDTIVTNIWYIRGQFFLTFCFLFWITLLSIIVRYSCKVFLNIFGCFYHLVRLWIFFSWCLVPCTLLIYDLIWLLIVSFAAGNFPIDKKMFEIVCLILSSLISGTYVVTGFWSFASFSESNWYLFF